MTDERIRELERAYRDTGDEEAGWAWAEARLRSEVSFMDLAKRVWRLEEMFIKGIRSEAMPNPQEMVTWIDEVNPPPVELCEQHDLPMPCKTCSYMNQVDGSATVVYLLLDRNTPYQTIEAIEDVFAATDDVRVYAQQSPGLAGMRQVAQGGYCARCPEGLVVAILLSSEEWDAFRLTQSMERPTCLTLEASGRHLTLAADPTGRVGAPLLTQPQLRERVPSWKS